MRGVKLRGLQVRGCTGESLCMHLSSGSSKTLTFNFQDLNKGSDVSIVRAVIRVVRVDCLAI